MKDWTIGMREYTLYKTTFPITARADKHNVVLAVQFLCKLSRFSHPISEKITFYYRSELKRIHIVSTL